MVLVSILLSLLLHKLLQLSLFTQFLISFLQSDVLSHGGLQEKRFLASFDLNTVYIFSQ